MSTDDPVVYAIPSRARAETLVAKTLPLLERLGVHPNKIKLYVHPSEWRTYREAILDRWPTLDPLRHGGGAGETLHLRDPPYLDLGAPFELRPGQYGVAAQRNGILRDLPAGTPVVSIDDDMRDLVVRRDEKTLEPITPEEWREVVRIGFRILANGGAIMWGLYPVPNPFFMKPRIRSDLCYVAAATYGFTVPDDPAGSPLRVSLEDKEDFERSLQCYLDGGSARFDFVSWRTEGYHGAGGMQADGLRTKTRAREATEELVRRFPRLVTVNATKRSGWVEPRLRDRR